jgi:hypothetical protein
MYAAQRATNDFVDIIMKEAPVFGYPHIIIFQAYCILLLLCVHGSILISNPVVHSVPSVAIAF